MYDIVVGRNKKDLDSYGTKGTILLGKHYVKMGQVSSLSNKIYLDVTRSHAVFVCGKRGGGKSYTMGVIAEGIAKLPENIRKNIAVVILDTMGIYWTMKFPNAKERNLLDLWNIEPESLDVKVFTPKGFYDDFKQKGIPTDHPFALKPSELDIDNWKQTLRFDKFSEEGIFINKILNILREKNDDYSIDDIVKLMKEDTEASKLTKNKAINMFENTNKWGISIVSQKLFTERMRYRRNEEFKAVNETVNYFLEDVEKKMEYPMVWLMIDEAHEFLPVQGSTVATDPLVTILREGRQPGISLLLATQQPGKIHTDVLTQSDTVISHRITAKIDTDALGLLMQSYMRKSLDIYLDTLPREKGAAIILDDSNERMYSMRVRPRFTWHGGEAPTAIPRKKRVFKF